MSNRTMTALIAARMEVKQAERRNAPAAECKQAVESLAQVVGLPAATRYRIAVRQIIALEREQEASLENK